MDINLLFLIGLASIVEMVAGHMRPPEGRYRRDAQNYGQGTTENIKEIFLGRCYESDCLSCSEPPDDCENLWKAFTSDLSISKQCSLGQEDYDELFRLASFDLPIDKTAFWSGTFISAHDITRLTGQFYTLEDSFTGNLINGLNWCPGRDEYGFNYTTCPYWSLDTCYGQAESVFWSRASKEFAMQARGTATALLSGTHPDGIFRNSSFFGRVEVPNMNPERLTHVNVVVLHVFGETVRETCERSVSLPWLYDQLDKKGITHSCEDDPEYFIHIQCSKFPDDERCVLLSDGAALHYPSNEIIYVHISLIITYFVTIIN